MDDDQTTAAAETDTTGIPGAVDPARPPANGAVLPEGAPRPVNTTGTESSGQPLDLATVPPIEPGAVPRGLGPSLQVDLRREIDCTKSTAFGSAAATIGEFAKSIVSIDDAAAMIRADKDLTPEAKRRRIEEKIALYAPLGWYAAEQTIAALSEVLEQTGGRWRKTLAAKTDTIQGAILGTEIRQHLRSLPDSERYAAISAALRTGDHDIGRAAMLVPAFLVGLTPAQRTALEAQASEQVDPEAAELHKAATVAMRRLRAAAAAAASELAARGWRKAPHWSQHASAHWLDGLKRGT